MQQPPYPYNQPNPYGGPQVPPPQAPRGTVSLDVIGEAWQILSPTLGNWILAALIYFGITYAINIVQNLLQSVGDRHNSVILSLLSLLLSLISFVVSQLLLGGLAKMAIETVRTRVANINEIWSATNVLGTLILSAILQGIFYVIACLPGLIVLGVSVVVPIMRSGAFNPATIGSGRAPNIPPALVGGMVGGILLGVLLMLVLAIPLAALLFMSTPLIVDRKVGAWEAISQSFRALKPHFWSAALLLLVLGLINMGGFAACCVGILFTFPLSYIAIALVYRDLFGLNGASPQNPGYTPPPIANPNY